MCMLSFLMQPVMGIMDLYVVSGGGQLFQSGVAHSDRLYINERRPDSFQNQTGRLPDLHGKWKCSGRLQIMMVTEHMDLFVGGTVETLELRAVSTARNPEK